MSRRALSSLAVYVLLLTTWYVVLVAGNDRLVVVTDGDADYTATPCNLSGERDVGAYRCSVLLGRLWFRSRRRRLLDLPGSVEVTTRRDERC